MHDITVDGITQLIQQGDYEALLTYLEDGQVSAAVRLVRVQAKFDQEDARLLELYYASYLWGLIYKRDDSEIKGVLHQLSNTRLLGSPDMSKTYEAASFYLDYNLAQLYQQQWDNSTVVGQLALNTVNHVKMWVYSFIQLNYTSIKASTLRGLLGITGDDNQDLLSQLNQHQDGWSMNGDVFTPPPAPASTRQQQAAHAGPKSDQEKRAKIDKLVQLAGVLEQQSYVR